MVITSQVYRTQDYHLSKYKANKFDGIFCFCIGCSSGFEPEVCVLLFMLLFHVNLIFKDCSGQLVVGDCMQPKMFKSQFQSRSLLFILVVMHNKGRHVLALHIFNPFTIVYQLQMSN